MAGSREERGGPLGKLVAVNEREALACKRPKNVVRERIKQQIWQHDPLDVT